MKTVNKNIICLCYGEEQEFTTRKEAINFYKECAEWSEGCERERYINILLDLYDGKRYCTDKEEW